MKHTAEIVKTNNGLSSSLLNKSAMFELHLNCDKENLNFITIRSINYKREIGLYLKNTTFIEMITKLVLNAILHHVG